MNNNHVLYIGRNRVCQCVLQNFFTQKYTINDNFSCQLATCRQGECTIQPIGIQNQHCYQSPEFTVHNSIFSFNMFPFVTVFVVSTISQQQPRSWQLPTRFRNLKISDGISGFQWRFQDFRWDFGIFMMISRFQSGFWDFYEDFKISDGISRFKWDFTEISSVILGHDQEHWCIRGSCRSGHTPNKLGVRLLIRYQITWACSIQK